MYRIKIPIIKSIIAPNKVLPIPKRFVNKGVSIEITPKAIRGNVVNKPNIAFERPVANLISSTKGPTPAIAGRKFRAINKIPISNKILADFDVVFIESVIDVVF